VLTSAILLAVPEAEPLVRGVRERFDPSAADGIPAHITLVYPFVPVELLDERTVEGLRGVFELASPFDFSLTGPERFPEALYLRPEPAEPFRALIEGLGRTFPEYPPYAGEFDDVIPHLTVAQGRDEELMAGIASELASGLPVRAHVAEATLMLEGNDGPWRVADSFRFGGG
jgi:2'-5' RNA ligase